MIRFHCPECQQLQLLSPHTAGLSIRCPECRSEVTVPRNPAQSAEQALPQGNGALRWAGTVIGTAAPEERLAPLPTARRVGLTVGSLFAALVGAALVGGHAGDLHTWADSQNWPTVQARVTARDTATVLYRNRRGTRTRAEEVPIVEYRYCVAGTEYTSRRLRIGAGNTAADNRYACGQSIRAYYNPSRPAEAIVERSLPVKACLWSMVGLAAFWGAVRLALVALLPARLTDRARWAPWSRRTTPPDVAALAVAIIIGCGAAVLGR